MIVDREKRPFGIACLIIFMVVATGISAMAAISLRWPGGPLDAMWRLNPHSREEFGTLGAWSPILLSVLCLVCAASTIGIWRRSRIGYRLVFAGLVLNLIGDLANVVVRRQFAAMIGIPIVAAILAYLTTGTVRRYFGVGETSE